MAINSGTIDRVYDAVVGSYLSEYMGLVFEEICRQYLTLNMDCLPFYFSDLGEWWGTDNHRKKEAQLDIVGVGVQTGNSSEGDNYLIGSCKYKNHKIHTDELSLIKDYASLFTTNRDHCCYYIFSKSGFSDGLLEKQESGEVRLFTLNDLYQ